MNPDIFQIITALASVGAFSLVIQIERRLTRIETTLKLDQK